MTNTWFTTFVRVLRVLRVLQRKNTLFTNNIIIILNKRTLRKSENGIKWYKNGINGN